MVLKLKDKKLVKIGNSFCFIVDKPIFINLDKDKTYEVHIHDK